MSRPLPNLACNPLPTPTYKWGLFESETTCRRWFRTQRAAVHVARVQHGWSVFIIARRHAFGRS